MLRVCNCALTCCAFLRSVRRSAGAHNLASVTFKGNLSLLIVASATEKQWAAGEKPLRQARAVFAACALKNDTAAAP